MKKHLPPRSHLLLFAIILISTSTLYSQTPSGKWIDHAATAFEAGDGTANHPYQIRTPQQLAFLALNVENGNNYAGTYFKVVQNIDLDGYLWVPVGHGSNISSNFFFNGIFDGNNCTISNLRIDGNKLDDKYYHTGLFGMIGDSCRIYNITLDKPVVKGKDFFDDVNFMATGALVGFAYTNKEDLELENCRINEPLLTGSHYNYISTNSYTSYTGGLVGYNQSTSHLSNTLKITGCKVSYGEIHGGNTTHSYTGGIIGRSNFQSIISDSDNCSSVTGGTANMGYAGGIAGGTLACEIINCYNTGTITAGNATDKYVGGITGIMSDYSGKSSLISNTYNNGKLIIATDGMHHIGGIAGEINPQTGGTSELVNCYSIADIETPGINPAATTSSIGGLVGDLCLRDRSTIKIKNSYSAGTIKGNTTHIGGITGRIYRMDTPQGAEITNCLAVIKSLNSNAPTVGRIVGLNEIDNVQLSGNYAFILGKSATGTTHDSKDGADWEGTIPGTGAEPVNSWGSHVWNTFTGPYLPQLANLPGQPKVSIYFKGEGTSPSPYIIATREDLNTLADHVNGDWNTSYADTYFTLAPEEGNSIDLNGYTDFTPIGHTGNTQRSFKGIFDGNGNTIANLYLDANQLDDKFRQSIALFGYLGDNGIIKNLTLDKPVIKGKSVQNVSVSLGSLVSYTSICTIENCHAIDVSIEGDTGQNYSISTGGLIGEVSKNIKITGSTVKGGEVKVPGGFYSSCTGGLVGDLYTYDNNPSITNCHTENLTIVVGKTMEESFTGGIVGDIVYAKHAEFKNNTVTKVYITGGDTERLSCTGGSIGYVWGNIQMEECSVKDSEITGGKTISNNSDNYKETYTAGLIGFLNTLNSNAGINRSACVNTTIQGKESDIFASSGGLVGYFMNAGSLTESYVKNVTVNASFAADTYNGGLIGYVNVDDEGGKFHLSQCFSEGIIQATDIPGTNTTSITLGGLVGMFWAPTNGINSLLKTAIIEDSYSYTTLISSNNTNGQNIQIGGIAGQVTNSGVPNQQGLSNIQVKNCFAAGDIRETNSNATYIYTGGIAGISQFSKIENNLVMLKGISTGTDIHRIIGKLFIDKSHENMVSGNFAFIAEHSLTGETGPNKPHGEDWTGLMAENPVNGWSTTTWSIDQTDYLMPKLAGISDQPDIRNLLINDITEAIIQPVPDQIYSGQAIEPELTLTWNNIYLIKNVDYTVTYYNNLSPGTATITITGIGSYRGIKTITFMIEKPDIPTSIDEANKDQNKLYTSPGTLWMEIIESSDVYIYTFTGALIKTLWSASGTVQVSLEKGTYIVRIEKEIYKIKIN